MQTVDVFQLKSWLDNGKELVLLDVRNPWEVKIAQISGSTLLPVQSLAAEDINLPKDKLIVTICHHGFRSARVALWLESQGYSACNLEGGIDAWAEKIDQTLERY